MLIVATIDNVPDDFRLIAQNMSTFEICGFTDEPGYDAVDDVPAGFEQRVLPGHYGQFLTLTEILNFQLIESGSMKNMLDETTEALNILFTGGKGE